MATMKDLFTYPSNGSEPIKWINPTYVAGTINATDIVSGDKCVIKTVGTTDYTTVGSSNNNVGQSFTATGTPTGTGTVYLAETGLHGRFKDLKDGNLFDWPISYGGNGSPQLLLENSSKFVNYFDSLTGANAELNMKTFYDNPLVVATKKLIDSETITAANVDTTSALITVSGAHEFENGMKVTISGMNGTWADIDDADYFASDVSNASNGTLKLRVGSSSGPYVRFFNRANCTITASALDTDSSVIFTTADTSEFTDADQVTVSGMNGDPAEHNGRTDLFIDVINSTTFKLATDSGLTNYIQYPNLLDDYTGITNIKLSQTNLTDPIQFTLNQASKNYNLAQITWNSDEPADSLQASLNDFTGLYLKRIGSTDAYEIYQDVNLTNALTTQDLLTANALDNRIQTFELHDTNPGTYDPHGQTELKDNDFGMDNGESVIAEGAYTYLGITDGQRLYTKTSTNGLFTDSGLTTLVDESNNRVQINKIADNTMANAHTKQSLRINPALSNTGTKLSGYDFVAEDYNTGWGYFTATYTGSSSITSGNWHFSDAEKAVNISLDSGSPFSIVDTGETFGGDTLYKLTNSTTTNAFKHYARRPNNDAYIDIQAGGALTNTSTINAGSSIYYSEVPKYHIRKWSGSHGLAYDPYMEDNPYYNKVLGDTSQGPRFAQYKNTYLLYVPFDATEYTDGDIFVSNDLVYNIPSEVQTQKHKRVMFINTNSEADINEFALNVTHTVEADVDWKDGVYFDTQKIYLGDFTRAAGSDQSISVTKVHSSGNVPIISNVSSIKTFDEVTAGGTDYVAFKHTSTLTGNTTIHLLKYNSSTNAFTADTTDPFPSDNTGDTVTVTTRHRPYFHADSSNYSTSLLAGDNMLSNMNQVAVRHTQFQYKKLTNDESAHADIATTFDDTTAGEVIVPKTPDDAGQIVVNTPTAATTGTIAPATSEPYRYEIDTVTMYLPGTQKYTFQNTSNVTTAGGQVKTTQYWGASDASPTNYSGTGETAAQFTVQTDSSGYLTGVTLTEEVDAEGRYADGDDIALIIESQADTYAPRATTTAETEDVFDTQDYWVDPSFNANKNWPTTIGPASAKITQNHPSTSNVSQNGSKFVRTSGFTKWQLEVEYPPMTKEQFDEYQGVANAVQGQNIPFQFLNQNADGTAIIFNCNYTNTGADTQPELVVKASVGDSVLQFGGFDSNQSKAFNKGEVVIFDSGNNNSQYNVVVHDADANQYGEVKVRFAYPITTAFSTGKTCFKNPAHVHVTLASDNFDYTIGTNGYYYLVCKFDLDEYK